MARLKHIPTELQASRRLFKAVILHYIVLLGFAMSVGFFIPLREFVNLEEQFLLHQEDRIREILLHEADNLMAAGEDWAHWTETWLFIRGENPDYVEDHLDLETVLNFRLMLISFVRNDGTVVWQMETDLHDRSERKEPLLPSDSFPGWIFPSPPSGPQSLTVVVGESKMLMTAVPVLRNDRSGESPGYLVMGRELDEAEVGRLSELTRVDLSLLSGGELAGILSENEIRQIREKGAYLRRTGDRLHSFARMEVRSRKPSLLVSEVRLPRAIMKLGLKSFGLYLLVSTAGLFLMALFLLRYIRRNYIAPVSALYWDLKNIREVGDLSFRMTVSGNDEFNQFRRGFNELLEVIEEQTGELTRKNIVLSEEANRDALTGLYNKRFFTSRTKVFSRQPGAERDLSLMMMDIDHFKMYNDRYGHIAGDACIRNVASVLRRVVTRPSDLCARYGGEEFVILLEDTGAVGAELVAARIMDQLDALMIENADSPVSPYLTVSMGIAWGRPGSRADLEALLEKADKALYASKGDGRNRFTFASDPD